MLVRVQVQTQSRTTDVDSHSSSAEPRDDLAAGTPNLMCLAPKVHGSQPCHTHAILADCYTSRRMFGSRCCASYLFMSSYQLVQAGKSSHRQYTTYRSHAILFFTRKDGTPYHIWNIMLR